MKSIRKKIDLYSKAVEGSAKHEKNYLESAASYEIKLDSEELYEGQHIWTMFDSIRRWFICGATRRMDYGARKIDKATTSLRRYKNQLESSLTAERRWATCATNDIVIRIANEMVPRYEDQIAMFERCITMLNEELLSIERAKSARGEPHDPHLTSWIL